MMPVLPPANCSSGKSGCLVKVKIASVKKGPQALVREGNMHKQEMIKANATSACQVFLGFIRYQLARPTVIKSGVSVHQPESRHKSVLFARFQTWASSLLYSRN